MKFTALLLMVSLICVGASVSAKNYSLWTALGTTKCLRGETPSKNIPVKLDSAGNEHEAFQIIIKADKKIDNVNVSVSDLKGKQGIISKNNIELRLAHYIELKQALGGGFGPGFYPDALLPMPSNFSVEQGNTQMVWVNVYTPSNTKAGNYSGYVVLKVDGKSEKVAVELRVRDFSLSVENHFGSAFALWGGQCAGYYGLDTASPEYKAMEDKYYWFMVGYRLPPDDLPVPVDSAEAARYLNDPRVTSFRIPYDPGKPEEFKARVAYLREKGWLDKGYVYTIDEPPASEFANCAAYGKTIDTLATDAKWLLTAGPHESMIGAVDIWCPVLSNYVKKDCQNEQAKGRNVWWYTCVGPQHPYPTYLINDSAVSHRILSWFQSMYKVDGVLYWATSIWYKYDGTKYIERDVWNDPLAFPGANGDGYLLYPGKTYRDDPIPTLRLEMIRQGNEDFEMLYMLQSSYAKLADELGVTKSDFDPYSRVADYVGRLGMSMMRWKADPLLLENTRRAVMNDISSVTKGPKILVSTSVPEEMLTSKKYVTVRVWAEAGTKISAKIYDKNVAKAVSANLVANSNRSEASFVIPLSADPVKLVVQAVKGKSKKTISRIFRTYSSKKTPNIKGDVVVGWNSQADIEKWVTSNSSIELAKNDRIGTCAKITFNANVEFPNIKLEYPQGFSNMDWGSKQYAAFSVYNPNDFPVNFIIKAYDREGKKFDGFGIYLDANESRNEYIDIKGLSGSLNLKNMAGYEFWMWNRSEPASIYLGPIVLTDNKPAAQ